MEKFTTMTKARLIYELNEVLHRDYGISQSIEDPITVRDLAIIVQALKQRKDGRRLKPKVEANCCLRDKLGSSDPIEA
jgi:hypothetical protein